MCGVCLFVTGGTLLARHNGVEKHEYGKIFEYFHGISGQSLAGTLKCPKLPFFGMTDLSQCTMTQWMNMAVD